MELADLLATIDEAPPQLLTWAKRRADALLGGREPQRVLEELSGGAPARRTNVPLGPPPPATAVEEGESIESAVTEALDQFSQHMLDVDDGALSDDDSLLDSSASFRAAGSPLDAVLQAAASDSEIEVLDDAELVEIDSDDLELISTDDEDESNKH